ncbi:hypothetical protein [Elizabethkingia sp. JS20170427COW]|uniref:hypothetical protein n=1 Tax=Elizabethkingia sp. JS20170427COW TaxID=2583851 RepID=UPI001110819C|nr:hypothetical protein [Elizabethkingia sp. JS20170427COW]QCX52355.1 hypothetical protein FGE20_00615 [Elizabethkingia sp. JS20170427COW]
MKKYILSAATLLVLASCELPAGGNKNMVQIADDQARYDDNMEPAEQEPNFGQTETKAAEAQAVDSVKAAAPKAVTDTVVAK